MLPGAAVNPWPFDLRTSQPASACVMVLTGKFVATSHLRSAGAGPTKKQLKMIETLMQAGTLDSVLAAASQQIAPPKPAGAVGGGKGGKEINAGKQRKSSPPDSAKGSDGWKTVQKKKEVSDTTKNRDKLVPGGWSVLVLEADQLNADASGVCLTSTGQAKTFQRNLKSSKPLAVLSPGPVGESSAELRVLVEDGDGRWQIRQRFLTHLGVGEVKYVSDAPKMDVEQDTAKLVLSLSAVNSTKEQWDKVKLNSRTAAQMWLQERAKTEVVEVQPPTRIAGDNNGVQLVVIVPNESRACSLRLSGTDGVFVRPFYQGENTREEFKVVVVRTSPMPFRRPSC